jgi:hypothetical protein
MKTERKNSPLGNESRSPGAGRRGLSCEAHAGAREGGGGRAARPVGVGEDGVLGGGGPGTNSAG